MNNIMSNDVKIEKPVKYNDDLARDICWKIAIWPWGLNTLLEHHENWPSKETLKKWLNENREFSEHFILAHGIHENHLKEERYAK